MFVEKNQKVSCVGCGAGHVAMPNATQCQKCPVGTYSDLDNATVCTQCPLGWSTADEGSISDSDCQEVCRAGHYSENGFAPCLPCPPGQYQALGGQSHCDLCPASSWTNGAADSLTDCFPADIILSNDSSVTAEASGTFSALTLRAYIHLNDLGVANVTFTFPESTVPMLSVSVSTHDADETDLPSNSSTSSAISSKAKSWHQLVLTVDASSGQTNVIFNNNTVLSHIFSISSSLLGVRLEIKATQGKVMVGGLYADKALVDIDSGDRSTCNGDATTNLLTWTPAPGQVHSPSSCDGIDECQSSPCSSHGACLDKPGGYECQCQEGWSGTECQLPPPPCYQHTCQNDATCQPNGDPYTCLCGPQFSGDRCQFRKVHGGLSEWSTWGNCSATCQGRQQRRRYCNNPEPAHGGDQCSAPTMESRECGPPNCPVDGQWGMWFEWSPCSATCGGGNRTRQRSCDNPPPQFGGDPCDEDREENEVCNTQQCPVNGGWGAWSHWTPCSVTCEGGTRSRDRSCDSPAPANGGQSCSGANNETGRCNDKACPKCSSLRRSVTTMLICEEESSPYLKTCNLTCAPGHATTHILPQYRCGQQTGYLWNDQEDPNQSPVLPVCSVPHIPQQINVVQYVPMKTGCDVSKEAVQSGIQQNVAHMPCASVGCQTSVSVHCGSPGSLNRVKRSEESLLVVLDLSMNFKNLKDLSDNQTADEYFSQLLLVDQSYALLANETEKMYSVTVGDQMIEPDVTSSNFTGSMQCPPGSIVIVFACVPCVPGSYETGGKCALCPEGQYEDRSGSTGCKPCPPNTAYPLPGAAHISQCLPLEVVTTSKPAEEESEKIEESEREMSVVIIGSLVGLAVFTVIVVTINIWIIVCRRRREKLNGEDLTKQKTATNGHKSNLYLAETDEDDFKPEQYHLSNFENRRHSHYC